MFNEILEYHDYTDMNLVDFDNNWDGLTFSLDINTETIPDSPKKKAFKGLERVLTIIARYRLFNIYKYHEFETKEINSLGYTQSEIIAIVKSELMAWFGFCDEETSFEAKDWFKHYYNNVANYPVQINDTGVSVKIPSIKKSNIPLRLKPEIFLPTEKPANNCLTNVNAILRSDAKLIYSWEQIANIKAPGFNKKLFTNIPNSFNTFKSLSYEKVIASAINLGSLNIFYLIVKEDYASEIMIRKSSKAQSKHYTLADNKRLDILLKYIGVCLIGEKYTGKHTNIVFDASCFSLWISNDLQKHEDTYVNANGEEIIHKYPMDNIRLTTILPCYLEKYGFRIMEKSEIINKVSSNADYYAKYQPDISEEDLLNLYLKIINKDISQDEAKYILFSDAGFGVPLCKHTTD